MADTREDTQGWVVTAAASDFARNGGGTTISTGITYAPGTVSKTGTVTAAASGASVTVDEAASVVNGTAVSGSNTATWTPTLTVALPSDALVGTYVGTITTSIS
jgi:hypothetical protein